MATGGFDSLKFEVQWDGSSWTDESDYVLAGADSITITRGRATEADDIQPGVLSATLSEVTARHIPDNPLSPLYPNVQDGARTRFSVYHSATQYFRHQGRFAAGDPQMSVDGVATATLPFQSVGLLGEVAGRSLRCDFVERWIDASESTASDVYPLEGTTLTNVGSGGGSARVLPGPSGAGTVEVSTPDGVELDSALALNLTGTRGPLIFAKVGPAVTTTNMVVIPFRTADRTAAGGSAKVIAKGVDSSNAQLWALKLVDNAGQCDLNIYDSANAFVATIYSGFAESGADTSDDQWFAFSLEYSGSQSVYLRRCYDDVLLYGAAAAAIDIRNTRAVVIGGECSLNVGAFVLSAYSSSSNASYLSLNRTTSAQTRFADLNLYGNFASTTNGSANLRVARKPPAGRTAFDMAAELCRTVGATITENQSAYSLDFWDSDTRRLPAVALTVKPAEDLLDALVWRKGDVPSVVTATWPGGQITFTDSTRPRSDLMVDTTAAAEIDAYGVASFFARQSRKLRLTHLTIDLAGGATDIIADVMALEVGDRIRVTLGTSSTDPLVAHYGRTYVDVYVMGWVEVYGKGVARFELDTIPADDPIEAEFDSDLRGRFCADDGAMTVTGGTAVGTTSTGTIIVTTSTGPTITTDATAYPLTLDWNGELVTITSAPASTVSPQTLTITSRGVAPSVARSHSTGETIDVPVARFTF